MKWKKISMAVLIILCLTIFLLFLKAYFDGEFKSVDTLREYVKGFGIFAPLVLISIQAMQVIIPILPGFLGCGVGASLFVYQLSGQSSVAFLCAGMYLLCALIRLAYFNVNEQQRQKRETTIREYYEGMPVTTIALFLPAIYLICPETSMYTSGILALLLVSMGILFISPFKLKKPKIIGKISVCVVGVVEFLIVILGIMGAA